MQRLSALVLRLRERVRALFSARPRTWRLPPGRDLLRAAGVAVAAFLLVNVAGEALRAPFDTLGDWVSWPRDPGLRRAFALLLAGALLANALVRERSARLRLLLATVFICVASVATIDIARFAVAVHRGGVIAATLVPCSAFVALFFAALAREAYLPRPGANGPAVRPARRERLLRLGVFGVVLAALPLLQMLTFGRSRYERPADCAVVFGARVWSDGRPSTALADRVDEAVRLHRRGLVRRLIMSGSIDTDVGFSEAAVMAARAVAQGVPREDILLDEAGDDTASTVRNTARLMREEGMSRALVVTHYYHEPRAKMLFDRAGIRAYTVPARMSQRLLKEPYFLLREVLAYYHSFLME